MFIANDHLPYGIRRMRLAYTATYFDLCLPKSGLKTISFV